MGLSGTTNEEKIWDYLLSQLGNEYGVAGLMGNLSAESGLEPNNMQDSYESSLGFNDTTYTSAVDSGKYTNFENDLVGYGLAQWTYSTRKKNLLNYAKSKGVSIGDLAMQLEFLIKELSESFPTVLSELKSATSVAGASNIVLTKFENPANQNSLKSKRATLSQGVYDKYAKKVTSISTTKSNTSGGKCDVSKVLAVAAAEVGYLEKASNSDLDDKTANSGSGNYTKYARDFDEKYPNWYGGKKNGYAWCTILFDWCFLTAYGYDDALRILYRPEKNSGAICSYALSYYKSKGKFYTDNPKVGDQIFLGTSLDNVTHTGLIEKIDSSYIYTIEGNTSDKVGRRTYSISDKSIVGFGRPAYDDAVSSSSSVASTATSNNEESDTVDGDVYVVKSGDTLSKIASKYGVSISDLIKINGISNPNNISIGQKIKISTTSSNSSNNSSSVTQSGGMTMGYTNSSLVAYTKLSQNHSGQRTHSIDRITPHCVVGQCSVETLGNLFYPSSQQASSQYGIGSDGRIGLYVEEKNRSWCSSSNANDQRAVTIECASDTTHPYAFKDVVYQSLIKLCVDICQRNGKTKLLWLGDKDKTLNYTPASNEMVLTVHRWFANKACPGDWMYSRMGDLASKVTAQLGGSTSTSTTTSNTSSSTSLTYAVGDIVNFIGNKHYASSNATSSSSCSAGVAKVTAVAKNAKHPYQLIKEAGGGSTVYGWVDASDISGKKDSETTYSSFTPYTVRVTASELNVRKGAGTNYAVTATIKDKGVYTIIAEADGQGATKWLKLKSGVGYIASDYTVKV